MSDWPPPPPPLPWLTQDMQNKPLRWTDSFVFWNLMTETELLLRLITVAVSVTTETERFIQIEDEGAGRTDWARQGLSAQSVRWAEYEYTQYRAFRLRQGGQHSTLNVL